MAIAFVAQFHEILGLNGGTSSVSFDTTGANFVAAVVADYPQVTASQPVTDNKGNGTYTGLTEQVKNSTSGSRCRIHYKENAAVGSGHTLTNSGTTLANVIYGFAFSGVATSSSLSNQNGSDSGIAPGTTIQPGSVAPTGTDVFIAGLAQDGSPPVVPITINSSFNTALYDENNPPTTIGGAASYKISASTENPTFTVTTVPGDLTEACVLAAFKASAGGGSTTTLTAVKGDLTLTGKTSPLADALKGVKGDLTLAGKTVLISQGQQFTLVKGDLSLTGYGAAMVAALAGVKGDLSLSGKTLTFSQGQQFTLVKGDITLSGKTDSLVNSLTLVKGDLTLTGQTILFSAGITFTLVKGDLTLSGKTAKLTNVVTLQKGNLALTGYASSIPAAQSLTLVAGALGLSGQIISFSNAGFWVPATPITGIWVDQAATPKVWTEQ